MIHYHQVQILKVWNQEMQQVQGAKPNEPVPKNTSYTTSKGRTTWYKADVVYDTKSTGPAAIPPENLFDVTRKREINLNPLPKEDSRRIKERIHQLGGYHKLNQELLKCWVIKLPLHGL